MFALLHHSRSDHSNANALKLNFCEQEESTNKRKQKEAERERRVFDQTLEKELKALVVLKKSCSWARRRCRSEGMLLVQTLEILVKHNSTNDLRY